MRQAGAVVGGAAVAALGAVVLGEYEFTGVVTAVVTGLLFGLTVSEVVVWIGPRDRPAWLAAAAAVAAGAGLVWAGWILVRHRDESIPGGAWLAAAVGAATAAVRARPGSARSGGSGSPAEP